MCKFRSNIAERFDMKTAVVAEYLWELCETAGGYTDCYRHGEYWCRCSAVMMTGEFPFLRIHMAKDAIYTLRESKIIKKACFNDNKFDHTSWYTFTAYGEKLMEAGCEYE